MEPGTWNLKRLFALVLLVAILAGCQPAATSPEPILVNHTYVVSDASILNPERGFYTPYELPGNAGFSPVRATGNTLVHLNIRLDDWRAEELPQDVLEDLQSNFDDIRDAGIKAIIRFAYNAGPYPDSEPDASKEQILRHIEQLTPFLQTNANVIAWLEAGFIGAWGEWHTSTNGLDNLTDKRDILQALLAAIPNRFVQVRYPANIIEMYPDPAEAARARVAHHNDCFLSSDTDVGTYERNGVNTIQRDQAYLAELTRTTPMSGETCAPYPPRSECASALQEMALLHFSSINEAYHKGIIRSWEAGGCLEEINNRLGYRITLLSADFNEQVRPGGVLNLTVHLQNTGFASIINERPLYVVVARDSITHYAKLDIDPRSWVPGTATLSAKLQIPSNAPEGGYQFALWLPDADEALRADSRYAVQFANENIWQETTGYNLLGPIQIDEAAGGSSQRGEKLEVIESTSSVESTVSTVVAFEASGTNELIFNPRISHDAETVYLSFDYAGAGYNAFRIFADTDQNPETGYAINGTGADMLFENHSWEIYSGSGRDWSWEPTELVIHFEDRGGRAQWQISRSLLNGSGLDVVFQLADQNWNTAFETRKLTYAFQ